MLLGDGDLFEFAANDSADNVVDVDFVEADDAAETVDCWADKTDRKGGGGRFLFRSLESRGGGRNGWRSLLQN